MADLQKHIIVLSAGTVLVLGFTHDAQVAQAVANTVGPGADWHLPVTIHYHVIPYPFLGSAALHQCMRAQVAQAIAMVGQETF
jgi:hypothetical protein